MAGSNRCTNRLYAERVGLGKSLPGWLILVCMSPGLSELWDEWFLEGAAKVMVVDLEPTIVLCSMYIHMLIDLKQ